MALKVSMASRSAEGGVRAVWLVRAGERTLVLVRDWDECVGRISLVDRGEILPARAGSERDVAGAHAE
jgi:hypothetical protein